MVIMAYMEIMHINTMPRNIYMKIIIMINRFYKLPIYLLLLSALQACSFLTPGMYMDEKTSWLDNEPSVYIESIDATIKIQNINNGITNKNYSYKIGIGDEIQITIWGIKEVFPMTNNTSSQKFEKSRSRGQHIFPLCRINFGKR